ncbi:MAG: PPC domain-containing DNA-binding protein [Succiniclasticum sp.]
MEFRKFSDTYVVRLDRGEEIIASLTEFCKKEDISLGSIEGLGAADHAVVGLYDVGKKEYHKTEFNGPMEITALTGNVSRKDGEVYLHIHICFCDEAMNLHGGHLNECRISATCELFVRSIPGQVNRRFDAEGVGLNLYEFS